MINLCHECTSQPFLKRKVVNHVDENNMTRSLLGPT